MNKSFTILCILLFGVISYTSCKKEYSCENCNQHNQPPIADAGPDQIIILPTDSITLDGSSSSDADGTISNCSWRKIAGPASFSIPSPSLVKAVVKDLTAGLYQVELTVTDNDGLNATDTMRVIVNDPAQTKRPPVAIAGDDQQITLPDNFALLDGSASHDPDNNISSYQWTNITGPSSITIENADSSITRLSNMVEGIYLFELKVTDADGLFSMDTVQIFVNAFPINLCSSNRSIINAQLIPVGILSAPKINISIGAAGNKIVFSGGYDGNSFMSSSTVDIYDILTKTWSISQLSNPRHGMAVTTANNKIFFGGGYFDSEYIAYLCNTVDIYDATTNSWTVDSLSYKTSGLVAATVGNKVLFAGGSTNNWIIDFFDNVDIYDLTTETWSSAKLSEARGFLSAVSINNEIYFAGGWKNGTVPSSRIDIYDNTTSSWTTRELNQPRVNMASITFDDKIFWVGGQGGNWPPSQLSHVEIMDVNASHSILTCLYQPNSWQWLNGAAKKNDKLAFFSTYSVSASPKFDIYDLITNTWSIGVLPEDIEGASIISVNNIIYVAGGYVNGILSNQVWKLEF